MYRMNWRSISFLLFVLLLPIIHGLASVYAAVLSQEYNSDTMRLELIHRHSPQVMGRPKTQLQRLKELVHSDSVRQLMILHKLRGGQIPRRKAKEVLSSSSSRGSDDAIEVPMHPAADYGIGQYFVAFKVGTPSQKFMLVADTGSDLTWMSCKYHCRSRNCSNRKARRIRHRRVFHANLSSSFKTIPCLTDMCKIELMDLFSLTNCPTPLTPCGYDYRYSDGSTALGFFANETVTVELKEGRKMKLHNVLIGCSESFQGQSFQAADGVMGLGYSKYSFAIKAAEKFGGKFSYCLVDHLSHKNVSNYLTFGSSRSKEALLNNMTYTELVLGMVNSFYAVNMMGISIGGAMLKIPSEVWDVKGAGGTILDSGSSLTFLTEPAYQPVMAALRVSLLKFRKVEMDIGPLEYCFNSTGFEESLVPRLVFHFADGAEFEPPVKSYVISAADGVRCLGFVSVAWPGTSVVGNIMQQNHLWEFDLGLKKLGFAPSSCT